METSNNPKIKQLLSQKDSGESLFMKRMLHASSWDEIQAVITYLGGKGWNRKKFFDICMYINFNEELQEEEYDIFAGIMDGLTGFCHGSYFYRLPNDPENDDEFVEYVRSNVWQDETW